MEIRKHEDIEVVKMSVNPLFRVMNIYLYFIDGLLVDTGPSIRKRALMPIFNTWDIEQIALTHHHEDHAGMASWLTKHTNAKIFVHEETIEMVKRRARIPWYRKLFAGSREAFQASIYPSVIQTGKYEFYPIETPGHTDDHMALFEPNHGWLFTGDLYITPYPKVFLHDESMNAYIQSIEKIQELDYQTIFCAHEGVVTTGKQMMAYKLDYLKGIKNEVIRLHRLGLSDELITKTLFPKQVKLEQLTFGSFSRLHLVRSCYINDGM
jgi:glyoxylase-like metal-dependent hydrolase (beta-lactamase superfamily II)